MPEPISAQDIVRAVERHVDLGAGRPEVVSASTGRFNTTRVVCGSSVEVVIRIAPPDDAGFLFYERNMMAQEPPLHKLVRERTDIPVPAVLGYDTAREILPRDYIVMERLPGEPLSHAVGVDIDSVWERVGRFLSHAHAIHGERYGYDGPHHVMPPQASWADAFRIMWNRLIDDIVGCGGYSAAEGEEMRCLLDRCISVVDRDVPASLLHMDVWHENVLVDDGQVTGLIDWDRALWGDPEIEFAVLDYCGVSVPAFWRGYGRERDTSPEARLRNALYLLYEVQKYIVINRARRRNPARADGYRRQSLQLARSLFSWPLPATGG